MAKLNVAIIFGGRSMEHDVSIQSAGSVISNVNTEKYNVHLIGITKKGAWLRYNGDAHGIAGWQENSEPIILPPDPTVKGYFTIREPSIIHKIDVAFPVMHGTYAEDGTIQSVLELAGIPYVGSGVLSSAVTMDKVIAKQVCGYVGIPQCKFDFTEKAEWLAESEAIMTRFENVLGYPIFVKPANLGSSVGINKAKDRAELKAAIDEAFRYDRKVIAEEFVDGREIECAVLGNDSPLASLPGEVVPAKEFYDYEAKYDDGFDSPIYIPAHISEEKLAEVRKLAVHVYRTLNCRGLSRVDFFMRKSDGEILLNEVNSLPGFTKISMYPKMMINMGIPYNELVDRLLSLAIENFEDKGKLEF